MTDFLLVYRYNSLPATCRNTFGYAEDALISIALHNLLVFMLMVGMSTDESLDLCQRLSAKTRLATVEEKLLQQTMQELEVCLKHKLLLTSPALLHVRTPLALLSCVVWLCYLSTVRHSPW